MPKRIPVKAIYVQRDGKQIQPKIGEEFDFTADELDQINQVAPSAVRKVMVEDKELAAQLAKDEKALAEAKAKQDAADKAAADQAAKDKLAAGTKTAAGKTGANASDL